MIGRYGLQAAGNVPFITNALIAAHSAQVIEPTCEETGKSTNLSLPEPKALSVFPGDDTYYHLPRMVW